MLKYFYKTLGVNDLIGKAFKIIDEKLSEILIKKGFSKISNSENTILFVKESDGYKVSFDETKNKFELIDCSLKNNEVTAEKILSTWLFDPQNDTEKEAKDIAADFAETLGGISRRANKKMAQKKKKSDDENNVNPLFLMNRIANIFPELKDAVLEEKENYENFRGVIFAREKAMLFVKETLTSGMPKDKFKKLCTVFSNLYASGDLDTKAIITIVFLNSIDDTTARENIENTVSEDLKAAMKEAFKLRGKKIKPEKIKKKSTFISDTLSAAQAQQKN